MADIPEQSQQASQGEGLENEFCTCGRYAWKLHCPHCGSSESYAFSPMKKRDYVTRPNGDNVQLTVYRCRKCSAIYNDDDWRLRCAAPHQRLGRRPAVPRVEHEQPARGSKIGDLSNAPPDALQEALQRVLKAREDKQK
jgi:hypothetical protein